MSKCKYETPSFGFVLCGEFNSQVHCCDVKDCYYKQIQQQKAENEELRAKQGTLYLRANNAETEAKEQCENAIRFCRENTQLKQQLEVEEKMIELMADEIKSKNKLLKLKPIENSYYLDTKEKVSKFYKQQSLSQMQKVGE